MNVTDKETKEETIKEPIIEETKEEINEINMEEINNKLKEKYKKKYKDKYKKKYEELINNTTQKLKTEESNTETLVDKTVDSIIGLCAYFCILLVFSILFQSVKAFIGK